MNHDKMSNISAKRGFLWPSFEIYSGVSGFTDYGPLGASLKNNIMQKWRKQYVSGEGFYEIEGPTVMPKEVLKASGHVDNFTDPMCKCEECGEVFRADHIIEEVIGEDVESLENEELKKQLREANEKLIDYEQKKRENEQFRSFLGLKETNPDYEFEPATVIGRDSTNRFYSFTIDCGSIHGVEAADPVITADGLVGIVWEVGLTYSHVRTILDISVEAGVYDISTRDSGIVTGDISLSSEGLCKLKYLPKDSGIANGNLIVTSGIGGVFPKDLPVGTVKSIEVDASGLSLTAVIIPSADIENVTDVLVIKSFNGQSKGYSDSNPEGGEAE